MKKVYIIFVTILSLTFPASSQILPSGSNKAVEVFHKNFPSADLDEVSKPKETDLAGGVGDVLLYWIFRFHINDRHNDVYITPEGLLVREQEQIKITDLPPAVAKAVNRAKPGLTIKSIQRQETFATLKFVATDVPKTSFIVTVEKEGEKSQITVKADATAEIKKLQKASGQGAEKDEPAAESAAKSQNQKEIKIPEKAAKAVKAVKAVYTRAIVQDVEDVAYDDKTGNVEIAYYEVEFTLDGKPKTVLATPEGIILYLSRPVEVDDIPDDVRRLISPKIPGGVIEAVRKQEENAVPKFVPLDQPRVIYIAEFLSKGKGSIVRYSQDGEKIEPFDPWGH